MLYRLRRARLHYADPPVQGARRDIWMVLTAQAKDQSVLENCYGRQRVLICRGILNNSNCARKSQSSMYSRSRTLQDIPCGHNPRQQVMPVLAIRGVAPRNVQDHIEVVYTLCLLKSQSPNCFRAKLKIVSRNLIPADCLTRRNQVL